MNRFQAAALVAFTVPIVGTACWLDVPNLESTEGGYPPRQASPAGEDVADGPAPTDPAPEAGPGSGP